MRSFTFLRLLVIVVVLPDGQAAPVPKRTNAKPAVIDAGTEKNVAGVSEILVTGARFVIRANEKVADLDIVRRQKDLEAWLKKNLRIERVKDTNLIHVSFQDGSAKEQAMIVNAIVDDYLNNDLRERRNEGKRSLKRVKDGLETRRRAGKLAPEQAAKWEEDIKKREEYIRTLPALVEHAKSP